MTEEIRADAPKNLPDIDSDHPEEVGARHGDATGAWRVLRNSVAVCIAALAAVGIIYAAA